VIFIYDTVSPIERYYVLPNLVLYEEEFNQVTDVIKRLVSSANAKVVFLVDKNGQLIASAGKTGGIDTTSLASLTAGNIAATGGLAKLIGEKEFSILFHEGEKDNIHISIIIHRVILVVIFDEKSSLGLVRLRVKKSGEELEKIFAVIDEKAGTDTSSLGVDSPFAEITDDDIENLFS
jgi:predicted regulator of Ras-like GTPase activity (Roadblock/LC7/MglB family)